MFSSSQTFRIFSHTLWNITEHPDEATDPSRQALRSILLNSVLFKNKTIIHLDITRFGEASKTIVVENCTVRDILYHIYTFYNVITVTDRDLRTLRKEVPSIVTDNYYRHASSLPDNNRFWKDVVGGNIFVEGFHRLKTNEYKLNLGS